MRPQDVGLQRVRVLVLVDQDVVEQLASARAPAARGAARASTGAGRRSRGRSAARLRSSSAGRPAGCRRPPRCTTGTRASGRRRASSPRVDRPRVDRRQRVLAREAPLAVASPSSLADQVHQVGGVGLVEHREVGTQAERAPVQPQQPVGDRVERPAPDVRPSSRRPLTRSARESISRAARRLNVSSRIRSGGTPRSTRWPTRQASVQVLPVPAPATTSSGRRRAAPPPAARG